MANIRIKDLSTDSALSAGDYVVVDSASEGSRKFDLGTEIADIKEDIEQLDGLSDDVKNALLAIAANVGYKDGDGTEYYQALYDALYPPAQTYTVTNTLTGCTTNNSAVAVTENEPYSATITASTGYKLTGATVAITMGGTDITATAYNNGAISIASVTGDLSITITAVAVTLSSISAVYTQSGTVYDTDTLDSLKTDLVVTATWSDASTSTVASADYTLSGTLTAGTSTVTVSYGGKTTTFTVTVTHNVTPLYDWDFTQSLVDSVSSMTAVTKGGASRDTDGVKFTGSSQCVVLTNEKVTIANRTVIIDLPSAELVASGSNHARLFSSSNNSDGNTTSSTACFVYQYNQGWNVYTGSAWGTKLNNTTYPMTFFNNKRLKLYIGEDMKVTVSYANMGSDEFTEIGTFAAAWGSSYSSGYLVLGGYNQNYIAPITISRVKIYEGEV